MVLVSFSLRSRDPTKIRKISFDEEFPWALRTSCSSSRIRDGQTDRHSRRILEMAPSYHPGDARHDVISARPQQRLRSPAIPAERQPLRRRPDGDSDLSRADARVCRVSLIDPATLLAPLHCDRPVKSGSNGAPPRRNILALARGRSILYLASLSRLGNSDCRRHSGCAGWHLASGPASRLLLGCLEDTGPTLQHARPNDVPRSYHAEVTF